MERYRPIRCNVNGIWYQKGMEGNKDGDWVKWKEHNEFMIYISGILEGMGMNKKDVNDIFDVMIIMKRKGKNEKI